LAKKRGKRVKRESLNKAFVLTPNLWVIFVTKYFVRPYRKFLNSISKTPPRTLVNQHSSFPLPLPMRVPVGFLVSGRCGNALNQTKRPVRSLLREARLRNNLKRKICIDVSWAGCRRSSPALPNLKKVFKFKLVFRKYRNFRFFCFLL